MNKLLTVLILLFAAMPASAQCYSRSSYYSTPYYSTPYVQPYYQPALVAVFPFVAAPSYTVGLVAPIAVAPALAATTAVATTTQTTTTTISNETLLARMDKGFADLQTTQAKTMTDSTSAIVAELRLLRGAGTDPMPKKQMPPAKDQPKVSTQQQDDVIRLITATGRDCRSCHAAGVDDAKSAGFTMFDAAGQFRLCKDGVCDQDGNEPMAYSMARKINANRKCPGATVVLAGEDKAAALRVLPPIAKKD